MAAAEGGKRARRAEENRRGERGLIPQRQQPSAKVPGGDRKAQEGPKRPKRLCGK